MLQSVFDTARLFSRKSLLNVIVLIDGLIILAPPLHWYFGDGVAEHALGYFLGASLFVAVSLPLISASSNREAQ